MTDSSASSHATLWAPTPEAVARTRVAGFRAWLAISADALRDPKSLLPFVELAGKQP
jgi:hypothetical protein